MHQLCIQFYFEGMSLGGIQVLFRNLTIETPTQLVAKPRCAPPSPDNNARDPVWSLVEYMNSDALDAVQDVETAHIWSFPFAGSPHADLKAEFEKMRLFSMLADPEDIDKKLKPHRHHDFWQYMKTMRRYFEGEVRLVDDGDWKELAGPAPTEKSFWHCQYAEPDSEQRQQLTRLGCRGARHTSGVKHEGPQKWSQCPKLDATQMKAHTGQTTVCHIQGNVHFRRVGTMLSYPRFLCLLLQDTDVTDFYTALQWWKTRPIICYFKERHRERHSRHRERRRRH